MAGKVSKAAGDAADSRFAVWRAGGRHRPREVITEIAPVGGWRAVDLRELWAYRDLLKLMAWRDVTVRYKQTILGPLWVILQPFLTMVVFTIIFGRLARVPSDGFPYPVFSFTALVPWGLFATSLLHASNSLVAGANLVKKVYFPRLIVPISCIGTALIDFFITSVVLAVIMIWYGVAPTRNVVWIPAFVLLAAASSLGASLWLSALNVRFRDVRLTVPFLVQLWFFVSPIAYPSSLVPGPWRTWYYLNPMVAVVEGFRWALLGASAISWSAAVLSVGTATVLLVTGAYFFRRMEVAFADVV